MKTITALFAIAAAGGTPLLRGQSFEVTPKAGVFVGMRSVLGGGALQSWGTLTAAALLKQRAAPGVGINVAAWVSRHFGFEFDALVTSSDLRRGEVIWSVLSTARAADGPIVLPAPGAESGTPAEVEGDYGAHVVIATARAVASVPLYDGAVRLHALGGVGAIRRGGSAYATFSHGRLAPVSVVGAGLRFRVTPTLAIRLDAEANLSAPKFWRFPGAAGWGEFAGDHLQHDVVLSAGTTFTPRPICRR